jgi:hypothetical protein
MLGVGSKSCRVCSLGICKSRCFGFRGAINFVVVPFPKLIKLQFFRGKHANCPLHRASGIFLAYIGIIYVSVLKEIALSKAAFTPGSSRLIIRDYTKIQLIKTYVCFFSMGGVFGLGMTNMTFETHYVGAALAQAWGAPLGGMGLS